MNITFFHKIAITVIRRCQAWLGVSTLGARAIVLNSEHHVLLVQHTYDPHWYIPGGGVKKGESVKTAMLRELYEEVGVTVIGEPQLLGIYHHYILGVNDYPVVYLINNFSLTKARSLEIKQIAWFAYDHLPDSTSPGTRRRLDEYFSRIPVSDSW